MLPPNGPRSTERNDCPAAGAVARQPIIGRIGTVYSRMRSDGFANRAIPASRFSFHSLLKPAAYFAFTAHAGVTARKLTREPLRAGASPIADFADVFGTTIYRAKIRTSI